MPLGEDDFGIGVEFAVRQPRCAVVHAPGQVADLGMQRTAIGDIHFLHAAADAEQRHAAHDADLDQRQGQRVARLVIRLVARIGILAEAARMHIGAAAGEQNAVDGVEQRADIGDLRRAGKDQRQRACDVRHRAQVALADALRGELALDQMRAADDADDRTFRHAAALPGGRRLFRRNTVWLGRDSL